MRNKEVITIEDAEDWVTYLSELTDEELICIRNRVKWECEKRIKNEEHI